MNKGVVDARGVIASRRREPGRAALEPPLAGHGLISPVNLTEVIGKRREKGVDSATLEAILEQVGWTGVAFDQVQARRAGERRVATRQLGLSWGDRACRALAAVQGLTARTTEAAWGALEAAIAVQVVR